MHNGKIVFLFVLSGIFSLLSVGFSAESSFIISENIGISKSLNKLTGEVEFISKSPIIKTGQDLVEYEKQVFNRHQSNWGVLLPALAYKAQQKLDNDEFDVLVVIKHSPVAMIDKTNLSEEDIESLIKNNPYKYRKPVPNVWISDIVGKYEMKLVRKGASSEFDDYQDVIFRCRCKKSVLLQMARDPNIASIEEYFEPEACLRPYSDLIVSTLDIFMANRGNGIRNATFESGLSDAFVQCIGAWPRPARLDAGGTDHSQQVFWLMMTTSHQSTPYHRNSWNYSTTASQQWIVDNNIKVLSQSTTETNDPLSFKARVMDNFSFRYPYPLFCNPAANWGHNLVVNWGSYNGLSVGNVRHQYNSTYVIVVGGNECTQSTNPTKRYGDASIGNDREMPYVVVPGYAPFDEAMTTVCGMPDVFCGTSLSAPILNAVCTNLLSARSELVGWPEMV